MSYYDPNRGDFAQEGAELRQQCMPAAGGPAAFPVGNKGRARPRPRTAAAGGAASLSSFFFPCLFICGVVFVVFFPLVFTRKPGYFSFGAGPTNESASRRHSRGKRENTDGCLRDPNLTFLPGHVQREASPAAPEAGGDAAAVRNRLDGFSTASSLHPSNFTIAALPAPLSTLRDPPRPPSSGAESPASPPRSPLRGPCAPPSFPRFRLTQENAGWTDPRPCCRPPRPGPLRRPPPSAVHLPPLEGKALIDPRARPAW